MPHERSNRWQAACQHPVVLVSGLLSAGQARIRKNLGLAIAPLAFADEVIAQKAAMAASFRAWPLVICGGLKIAYDLLLLVQFRHVKPPEER
jgi:hypothetical protein